jgi:hypothetical protein
LKDIGLRAIEVVEYGIVAVYEVMEAEKAGLRVAPGTERDASWLYEPSVRFFTSLSNVEVGHPVKDPRNQTRHMRTKQASPVRATAGFTSLPI